MTRLPTPAFVVCALAGYLIALYPGTLPRGAVTMTLLTTALAATGAIVGTLLSRRSTREPDAQARRIAVGAGTLTAAFGAGAAVWWQTVVRAAVGAPPVDVWWWAGITVAPAAAVAAIALIPRTTAVVAASAAALTAGLLAPAQAEAHDGGAAVGSVTTSDGVLRGDLASGGFADAAADLVHRWVDAGGVSADTVVVAVPTGSGWVDSTAVEGFTRRFGHDIRVLSLPYSDVPSWQAFVSDRTAAAESAIAVVRHLAQAVSAHPGHHPRLVLYGQSLGAVGADAARVWLEDHHPTLLSETVLTAPPAGTVEAVSRSPRKVLANRSDPVVRWSASALWHPAGQTRDTVLDGPRVPEAPWLPVVSFLQTSVDLLSALDGPPGVGHRYGVEQVG